MQDNNPNLKELARMAGIPTEPVSIVDVPNISTPQADLADEIAEAISDTLDMDWQPSWAAPNIIAIINRERRLARIEGAKAMQWPDQWPLGTRVRKRKGSSWQGRVVGYYSTHLTPRGYAVESEREPGSVQIYPKAALEALDPTQITAQEPKP